MAFQSWHGMSLNSAHDSPNLALVCGEDKVEEFAKEAGVRVRGDERRLWKVKVFQSGQSKPASPLSLLLQSSPIETLSRGGGEGKEESPSRNLRLLTVHRLLQRANKLCQNMQMKTSWADTTATGALKNRVQARKIMFIIFAFLYSWFVATVCKCQT